MDASVNSDIYELSGWYFHRDIGSGDFILVNYDDNPIPVNLDPILNSNNTPFSSLNFFFKWQSMSAGIWEYAKGNAISTDDPADNEITLTPLVILPGTTIDLPPYSITRISINSNTPIARVDLNNTEFCCHEMLNVRASNIDWSEGYYWSINNEIVEINDNPFYVEIPELASTQNQNIKLHDYLGNVVWTSDFLVNRCPTSISIATNLDEFCPGDQIHLTSSASATFSNPWQYHWTPTIPILNGDVNLKDVYANPTHNTMFRQYIHDGTCWLASNDLVVESENPEPFFSSDELLVCNTAAAKTVELVVKLANELSGSTYTYDWKDENGTTVSTLNSCSINHTSEDQKYTVTVTSHPSLCFGTASIQVWGVDCCQPISPLNSDLDLTSMNSPPIITDIVDLDDELDSQWSTIPVGVIYNPGNTVEIDCSPGNDITDVYINRKLNVDLRTTLIGCTLHLGEEAEINLDGASDLVLVGCSLITCNNSVYTWRGMTASGQNQMIVTIPNGSVETYISNAEKAIDLSDKAEFLIVATDFFNNLTAVNLHDYPSTIKAGVGNFTYNGTTYKLNNIYSNNFNSYSISNWPTGFSNKGFLNSQYAISCSWIEGLQIGKVSNGNTFKNSAVGINLINSSATIISNTFSEMYQPHLNKKISGVGIYSTEGDLLNDVNVIIGDISIPNSGNVFNDVNNSIVIKDGGKYKISSNDFWGANLGQNFFDVRMYEITGADIEITNNEFHNVQTGIYGYNIYPGSKLDIVGNHFTDPEPTVGNPNFRHTAITLQNQQQFNNEEIRIISNVVNNLRIGIHLNNTSGAFVISNDVNLNFTTTTALTDPIPVF
ncbi:MAG: hypothetical protein IPK10_07270 [Bacteroidetes bacterium]|nr:hypothetical protein [Bacteroidota bacterium]